jgi:hypothetical protein
MRRYEKKKYLQKNTFCQYSGCSVIILGDTSESSLAGVFMGDIRVTCKTADSLPYGQIELLQGKLKDRTDAQIDNICHSIIKHGWAFPEFIWQNDGHNYCLDGHGRQAAIPRLIEMGYAIPLIPVVYVEANSEEEAKELLLKCISQFGKVAIDVFLSFTEGLDFDFSELDIPGISDIIPQEKFDMNDFFNDGFKPEKKEKVRLCPHCGKPI